VTLSTATKFFVPFSRDSLVDVASGTDLSSAGSQVVVAVDDDGYRMKPNQYLFAKDVDLQITTAMSLGFVFSSNDYGMARNPNTGQLSPLRVTLLESGPGVYDETDGSYLPSADYLLVYESSVAGNKNRLVVTLYSASLSPYTVTTDYYSAGQVHHVWVAWNGSSGDFKVWIDGKIQSLSATGSVPASTLLSTAGVWINRLFLSPNYDVASHDGILAELYFANEYLDDDEFIQKVVNQGVGSAADVEESDYHESVFPLFFDDPAGVKVTAACHDGTAVYVARTDGLILEGNPVVWGSRRDFRYAKEDSFVETPGAVYDNGFLKITSGMVSL
jgi:hypothetical protein